MPRLAMLKPSYNFSSIFAALKKIGCFNHRVVTLVEWLILVSQAHCIKTTTEGVSLLFSSLKNERMGRKQRGNWLSYTLLVSSTK